MPIPIWAALAAGGAGLGLLKSEFIDKPNEKKDRIMQALTMRYSPWTGLKPEAVERASAFGSAIQGGVQGAALGQGIESLGGKMKLQEGLSKILTPGEKGGGLESLASSVKVEDIKPDTFDAIDASELPEEEQGLLSKLKAVLGARKNNGY